MTDLLAKYQDKINFRDLAARRRLAASSEASRQAQYQEVIAEVESALRPTPGPWEIVDGAMAMQFFPALSAAELTALESAARGLMPWRKGPFRLGNLFIDSEWRSDFKWERIAAALPDLQGKRVADVGASNGYYMFRLVEQAGGAGPELVLGMDPAQRCYYQFEFLRRFYSSENLQMERLGVEDLDLFPAFFDVILCLGVVYHQREPLRALKLLLDATVPGGTVIVESQGIPGDDPVAFFPPDRYGKLRNVYFVPTAACLKAWMERVGFCEVEIFSIAETTAEEQRRTLFSPDESLADFLDPNDSTKTVEGWPAPLRIAARGRRPLK